MGWDAFRQGYKKADMRNNTVFVRQSTFITRMPSCKVSLRWGCIMAQLLVGRLALG